MVHLNGWMSLADPYANAIFARAGWDSVTLDMQHGLYDERAMFVCLQALSAVAPKRFVRLRANDPALAGRALDASADGVIAPLINSVADARLLARACYYPPKGERSFGPGLAALRAGQQPYMAVAESITVLPMVETRAAFDAVDEILAVPGISGVFVGPNDLALSMGFAAGSDREETELLEAFRFIVTAAQKAGKVAGIYCTNAAYARRMGELGFSMVTAGTDTGALAASQAMVHALRC